MRPNPQDGRTVYVRPDDVVRRPMVRRGREIGLTFRTSREDVRFDAEWAARTGPGDQYLRTLPNETSREADLADRADGFTRAPWWRDYLHGGRGPIHLVAHGIPGWFIASVRAGAVVWDGQHSVLAADMKGHLSGRATWRLLRNLRAFNELLDRRPGASIAATICHVLDSPWTDEFVLAMRAEGFTNEGHFGHGPVFTMLDDDMAIVGALHNRGFDTYLPPGHYGPTMRVPAPGTRYSPEEIMAHEAARLRERFER